MAEEDLSKYLDPKTLSKISRLELKARLIVEGFISGLHRSPYHGFSVEFAEHREYVPGDDLKHLDWKVYGRSDRYYIKQYEEETNLRSHVVLDCSESMRYSSGNLSKYEYGAMIAASLAYLILRQQDAAGLVLFDSEIKKYIPPTSNMSNLRQLIHEIDVTEVKRKTDMGLIFHNLAERITRKGLVIIISDFFDSVDKIVQGLRHLRHKKHEVLVFHVLDPAELDFPFEQMTLFDGLEEYPDLLANPRALRQAYLEEIGSFMKDLKKSCQNNRIDYVRMDTRHPLDVALTSYLATRRMVRTGGKS
jgi:uncharacterized protein (DUF58 family)